MRSTGHYNYISNYMNTHSGSVNAPSSVNESPGRHWDAATMVEAKRKGGYWQHAHSRQGGAVNPIFAAIAPTQSTLATMYRTNNFPSHRQPVEFVHLISHARWGYCKLVLGGPMTEGRSASSACAGRRSQYDRWPGAQQQSATSPLSKNMASCGCGHAAPRSSAMFSTDSREASVPLSTDSRPSRLGTSRSRPVST
jgi:hypothetical protein